jgi:glycosyltransferase involved in cell wall biosynthesis
MNDKPVIFISARLIERLKGLMNFFNALDFDEIRKARFVIAGDGEDRSLLEKYLRGRGLGDCVALLGNCPSEKVVEEYGRANGFCLPSFSDPSPLSVIEALRMRLPLLISNRCGNHFEAVVDGSNGFIFDPEDSWSIRDAYRKFVAKSSDWEKMGAVSEQIYNEKFEKTRVLSSFVDDFKMAVSKAPL